MSDKVVIIGAVGHAKVIADILLCRGVEVLGFLDDDPKKTSVIGLPVLGPVDNWPRYRDGASFILGIGSNAVRRVLAEKISGSWYTAVHPTSLQALGMEMRIGNGTVVMANAAINAGSQIGKHCIINTGAVVEHDNVLEDCVHISPNATLCGGVHIGAETHIGAGAVIRNNISVCEDVTVGAGAVVVRNITEPGVYVGVPARKIANRERSRVTR